VRAALIPPRGLEKTALASDLHLVLPFPELVANQVYVETYIQARRRGDYVILDNGCAEGNLVSNKQLMDFAAVIQPHEIVAPDVLDDASRTWELTSYFLADVPNVTDYNIMAVLQGTTLPERIELLRAFATVDAITAIGIPKIQVRKTQSPARLQMAQIIQNLFPDRFQLHLLGLSHAYPTEMHGIVFPDYVRSMDSAQPYKVSEVGKIMSTTHADAKRRDDYFTRYQPVDEVLLRRNIRTFLRWAGASES
jgi:hypothetical protein